MRLDIRSYDPGYGKVCYDVLLHDTDGRLRVALKDWSKEDVNELCFSMFDDPPTNEDGVVELLSGPLDEHRLNEAKWAACNHRYYGSLPPTMEEAAALALKVVCAYLGLSPEEWIESGGEPFDPLTEQLVAGSVSTSQSS